MRTLLNQLGATPVEHGTSRLGRWLTARWLSFGAWIAVIEGILVLAGPLDKWLAVGIALLLLVVYFTANRNAWPATLRIVARIVALSQVLVLFVPLLVGLVTFVAIIALAVIAALALVALLSGR